MKTLIFRSRLPLINYADKRGLLFTFFIILFSFLYFCTSTAVQAEETTTSTCTDASLCVSATTTLEVILATTTINLQIITFDQKLYSDEFVVTACQSSANSSSTALTPYCALQQVAEQNSWDILFNDYGGAKFLNKINQYDGADWNWWAFFHNLDFASEALNQYELKPNNDILLSYGVFPLKLETSTTTPQINTTTTLNTKQFGFDSSWMPSWSDAVSSTVIVNNINFDNPNGIFELFITTSTAYDVYAMKNGFVDSKKQIIMPQEEEEEDTKTDNGNNSGSNPTTSTNTPLSQDAIKTAADKILNYLKSQQDASGKIIDANISDWALMAFAANNQYAHDIKSGDKSLFDFALAYDFTDPSDLNICATYPRHILALLSAGVDKHSAKLQELKTKIKTECYKNNIFGLAGINDDIFGLFGLLALDEGPSEPIVSTTINAILADQQTNGSFTWAGWPGVDITGAAINVLKYAQTKGAVVNNDLFTKAKNYLKSQQLADGGFGFGASDALTTDWAVMGINALCEGQNEWFNASGKNPWYPLVNLINTAGYYESAWTPGTIDWFATKHAVPALLEKSWPIILPARQEETNIANNSAGSGSNYIYTPPLQETPTTTATCTDEACLISTTTLNMATTTADVATTTPAVSTTTLPAIATSTDNGSMEQLNDAATSQPINHLIIKPLNTATQPLNTSTLQQNNTPMPEAFLTSASTSTIPSGNPAKTVFGISLTMASGLGLYLAWRLIQTVI